jgi:ligand-binding sensor domain-containing protein/signal transduction histidine kinase
MLISLQRWNTFSRMVALCVLIGAPAITAGLSPSNDGPLAAFSERKWQMQDGLPEQVVQAFAQTADRYLWIGTTGGLLRFDGERFLLFNRDNNPAFHENNVFCLLVTSDKTLWVGMEGGGLLRYRDGNFRAFSSEDGLTNSFVRALHQDRRGKLWVGTDDGLFVLRGGRFVRVDKSESLPLLAVHAIFEAADEGLWVGGSRLFRLNGGEATEYPLGRGGSQNRVKSIVQTHDGTIWVGTVSGLKKMPPGASSFSSVPGITGTVRFLRQTSDGVLWIGTIGRGLDLYRDGHFSRVSAPDALPSNTLLNLYEDRERNIWIGTQGGMLRLSRTPVRTITLPDASDSDAETVYQDRDGDVWVAAVNLFRVHNGRARLVHFAGISGVRIRNVFRDREGALWIGTEGEGAYRHIGSRLIQYSTKQGLVNNFVRAFLQSRDGSVWIATDEGVSRWTPRGIRNFNMQNGLCYFSTRSLLEDRNGDIWIGTDHGISHIHQGAFVRDAVTTALQNEKIWALHQDPDGGLWFGTRTGGLYRWRDERLTHYTVEQGLASNGIFEILEDSKGTLWISGPNGISAVSRKELDGLSAGSSHRVSVQLYGVSDGLETIQMCGGEKPAGLLTTQGEVWFPSSKGVLTVPTGQLESSKLVPVVIDQVIADGLSVPAEPRISLSPDNAKVEFHFGVVLLRSQERVRFRYMLEGFDKQWSEPSLSRAAYYTNLPPGNYTFRVAAFELSNPEQLVQTSLEIIQKPHFYRTPWFLAACIALLGLIVWGIYEIRITQVHARFQAVLKERNRLAREMHDTLIQGCASASALLEAHSSMNDQSSGNGDLLEYARGQLRRTIDEARQAVWDLRQATEDESDVTPLLRKMAERVSHEFAVPIECQVAGRPFSLDPGTMHDVLMIAREALYNSARHAQPTSVRLKVSFDDACCMVEVHDDGAGFDANASSNGGSHYGLIGIRERVERLGGTFTLTSRPGSGTTVTVKVPRKVSRVKSAVSEVAS